MVFNQGNKTAIYRVDKGFKTESLLFHMRATRSGKCRFRQLDIIFQIVIGTDIFLEADEVQRR